MEVFRFDGVADLDSNGNSIVVRRTDGLPFNAGGHLSTKTDPELERKRALVRDCGIDPTGKSVDYLNEVIRLKYAESVEQTSKPDTKRTDAADEERPLAKFYREREERNLHGKSARDDKARSDHSEVARTDENESPLAKLYREREARNLKCRS